LNAVDPFRLIARPEKHHGIVNYPGNSGRAPNDKHTGRSIARPHTIPGKLNEGANIVGQYYSCVTGRPFQDLGIVAAGKTDILDAYNVGTGDASENAAKNVVIEVLVR
jgi:hypothetical protein